MNEHRALRVSMDETERTKETTGVEEPVNTR